MVLLFENGFSGWGQFLQSFYRSTREYVISLMASPLVIGQIHLCSCKSFAKIVLIQKNYIYVPWTQIITKKFQRHRKLLLRTFIIIRSLKYHSGQTYYDPTGKFVIICVQATFSCTILFTRYSSFWEGKIKMFLVKIYKNENNSAHSETISPHCEWCSAFRLEHARFQYLTAVLFSHAFYSLESVKWPVVILTLIWTLFSYLCT